MLKVVILEDNVADSKSLAGMVRGLGHEVSGVAHEVAELAPLLEAIRCLTAVRHEQGLTQRQLAQRLNKPPSFVAKIEQGERRVDLVEFIAIARALSLKPSSLLEAIEAALGPNLDI